MNTFPSRSLLLAVFFTCIFDLSVPAAEETPQASPAEEPSRLISYHTQVKPLFQAHCQGCHQAAKPQGQYVMTEFQALLAGGESGEPAIVPGKADASELLSQITPHEGVAAMPKNKAPLSPEQIATIRSWIEQGAKDDTPASAQVVYDAAHPPVYHQAPVVTTLDFSPDGKLLAVSGHHEVLIHRLEDQKIVARLVGVSDRIESLRFSPDGTRLAVSGGAPARMGEVQVWQLADAQLLLSVPVTYDTVYGVSWSPDGTKIAFGGADNSLRVIEAETGKEVLFQGSHSDWVLDTVFSQDGSHLVSVGRDQTAKLVEFESQRFVDNVTSITPGALKGGLASVDRHPSRDEILIGGADGVPRTYRMHRVTKRVIGDDSNLIRQFPALPGRIFAAAYRPDGKQIVAGSSLDGVGHLAFYDYQADDSLSDELKKIFETVATNRKPEQVKQVEEYHSADVRLTAQTEIPGGVYSLAYHPQGDYVAVAGADGQVRFFNTQDAQLIKKFSAVPLTEAVAETSHQARDWKFGSAKQQPATESLPAEAQLLQLTVSPERIVLSQPLQYTQLLVTATLTTGDPVDVTRQVKFEIDPAIAGVDPWGLLQPRGDGQTQLQVTLGDRQVSIPVEISGQQDALNADYLQQVTPVLSKLGCNQGTCHGSAQGKAGFKLSLRGYDPLFDVRALTDDHASRRSNVAAPEESLMLLKAIGGVPHAGGQLTTADHKYYQVLKSWIVNGARLNLEAPRVAAIEVFPKNPTIQQIDSRQQVRVVATYTDGTTQDVTYEAFVESGNTEVATINSSGLLVAVRRGEAPILARYEGAYAATTLTVMGDRTGFEWVQPETYNKIDELVAAKWKRMKIQPSELCSDADFMRRISIDLTGLPPTSEAVQTFLNDPRPSREKREALIDYLIGSSDYVENFSNKWADLLQVNGKFLGREGAVAFRDWIRQQVASNRPYDEFVKEILVASGSNKENPPASYFKILRTPEDTMENTTHLFLGVRFNCNKCHDHPFERWTQDQYYETAAYFAQVDLKRDPKSGSQNIGGSAVESGKPLYEIVADKSDGELIHERTNQVAVPEFPYESEHAVPAEASRRERLAAWMTSPDNYYFARSYVNRLWGYLLGTGIIEPIDDIRAGNPPTNPELLEYLTEEFLAHDFDVQHIVRLICQSRTYQLALTTNRWNEDDQINFSHAKARRLSAEVLFDAVHLVTGSQSKIPGVPPGTRAAALGDSQIKLPDGFLNSFGRPTRESSCECERSNEVQLGPVMALVSGPTVAKAIADPENALPTLVKEEKDNAAIVRELFLRILNRPATEKELAVALTAYEGVDEAHEALVQKLTEKEAWWKPIRAQKEEERTQAIAKATADLQAYEAQIAPQVAQAEQEREQKITAAKQDLQNYEEQLETPYQEWLAQQRETPVVWEHLTATELTASNQTDLKQREDGSVFATLKEGQGDYQFLAQVQRSQPITGIRIEALTDPALPRKGPGLPPDGNFVLTEFDVLTATQDPQNFEKRALQNAKADFSQANYDVKTAIDGQIKPSSNGWAVAPETGKDHWATFEFAEPVNCTEPTQFKFVLHQHYQGKQHWLGRFRISFTTAENAEPQGAGQTQKFVELLQKPAEELSEAESQYLKNLFKKSNAEWQKKQQTLAEARKPLPIDPQITALKAELKLAELPVEDDFALLQLRKDVEMSAKLLENERLTATQDLTWALINSPAFLFNR